MMIENYEDTVSDNNMTMDEIMSRDQRTTFHRVHSRTNIATTMFNTHINDTRTINIHNEIKILNSKMEIIDKISYNCSRTQIDEFDNCDSCRLTCSSKRGIKRLANTISSNRRTRNNRWLRLGTLLLTLLVVSVQGAPTTMTLENRRLNSPEKWVNPCGLATEDIDGDSDDGQLTDSQLLDLVVVQARNALDHAQVFRDDYIKQTFKIDFADLHSTWKDNHYDWLPGPDKIPKQLGEQLAAEYLNKLGLQMLDNVLLDAYEYMQIYAVGLEQIVWDQEDYRLEFLQQFKDTESRLQALKSGRNVTEASEDGAIYADVVWSSMLQVLCELQVALMERGVTPRNNITRDAMPNDYRSPMSTQATFRDLRDWLIFRDYMNGLEYVEQVFKHLRRELKS